MLLVACFRWLSVIEQLLHYSVGFLFHAYCLAESLLHYYAGFWFKVAYYNESLAVWEPLVEPIEDEGRHRPWEISLQVSCTSSLLQTV